MSFSTPAPHFGKRIEMGYTTFNTNTKRMNSFAKMGICICLWHSLKKVAIREQKIVDVTIGLDRHIWQIGCL